MRHHQRTMFRRYPLLAVLVLAITAAACGADNEAAGGPDSEAAGDGDGASTATEPESGADGMASEPEFSLQYATYSPETAVQEQAVKWWIDEVAARTDGRVAIEPFYGGSLLGAGDMLEGIKNRQADSGLVTVGYYRGELPQSALGTVPFETENAEATLRAVNDLYLENETFQQEYDAHDLVPLLWQPIGYNTWHTAEPIESVEDIQGLQLRAIGYISDAIAAVGANPITLSGPELYEALERGVIDGDAAMAFEIMTDFRLEEAVQNHYASGIGNVSVMVSPIHRDTWDSFPEDIQQVFTDLRAEFIDQVMPMMSEREDEICQIIEDTGGTFSYMLTEDEIAEWEASVHDSIVEQWIADTGLSEDDARSVLEDYRSSIAEYEASVDYTPGAFRCAEQS